MKKLFAIILSAMLILTMCTVTAFAIDQNVALEEVDGRLEITGAPAEVFSHSKELQDMGLTVPLAAQVAMGLRARGLPLPEDIYTNGQLIEALLAVKGGEPDA